MQVSIQEVEAIDAPVAVRFTDRHQQTWDVRYFDGRFFIPTGYDGLAEAVRVTPDDLVTGNPAKARGLAMLLRSLMRASGSSLDYPDCVALFNSWQDIPLENGELGGNQIVDVDQVPTLQISGPTSRFEPRVKEAYETAIIVGNEVYRHCEEPRFVLSFEDEYDPERLIVRVDVEVEPQLPATFSGVRGDVYPHEAWERPALRIDRHDDLGDLIEVYARKHADLRLELPSVPEIIIDPLLVYNDEADMLQRTAAGLMSDGHCELMWVDTEVIHRWAHLKESISAAHDDPSEENLEALNASMKAYRNVLGDEARTEIIEKATARFDIRPVMRSVVAP
ncbi:hypothetical protein [Rhizobium sp. MHM7A]|uniref:hypothetical protein n=1 Tax=Rhizobium sp. MHM7A TaxID=2583233 RepID=UPI001106174F|nr:hypothetical protein [Rhizobium sp. MHM7A]TLX16539.1 hypothetical protein FFR93_04165 [Rhizobium sp. MHM7A]